MIRSQDRLLEEFQSTERYQKHVKPHYVLHMMFLTDLDSTKQRKASLPSFILFLPESLEKDDSIVYSHRVEVKGCIK